MVADLAGWWNDYFFGTVAVLQVFATALVLAVAFGLVGSAAKLSGNPVAVAIAKAYTIVFRGTPELLVLLIFYFGLFAVWCMVTLITATDEFVAEYDEPYYESLNALPKIVFSSTLQEPLGWSNSTVISATTRGGREHAISDSYWGSHYVGARRV